jgi:alpha,alpha-trehalase
VFCNGTILDKVQNARIFNDSKTFVDMPLKYNVDVVLKSFAKINSSNASELRQFVDEYFYPPGSDLVEWIPPDWNESPQFLSHIVDMEYRQWAKWLNGVWLKLGRRVHANVSAYPDRHSLIPVPKPFIVPGGRFREFYYWDSFWIIHGLLVCNMTDTVRSMLVNFNYLIDRYGMVPNGGRTYYSRRSQPPLLTLMVWEYYEKTSNLSFVADMLPNLKREHLFWMTNRTVNITDKLGQSRQFVRYKAVSETPRPESYREDKQATAGLQPAEAAQLYQEIASATESGWDFSSRWMSQSGFHAGTLQSLRTSHIIPVDLNAIMCQVELILHELFSLVNNTKDSAYYKALATKRAEAIESVLWNETVGMWQDFDMKSVKQIGTFYSSTLVPLATQCYSLNQTDSVTRVHRVVETVKVAVV